MEKTAKATKILCYNAGSSSLKGAIYDDFAIIDNQEKPLVEYRWEKDAKKVTIKFGSHKYEMKVDFTEHGEAFHYMVDCMQEAKAFYSIDEVRICACRAVNGGPRLQEPIIPITDEVVKEFKKNITMAPEHNPAALECSEAARKIFKSAKHYYVFDTGFHRTIPMVNKLYALPYDLYEEGVKVYGAHGISHADMTERAAEVLKIDKNRVNLIICHLGNGGSISCVENGECIDTTMGYTPTDGIIMGTRCGHIDAGMFPKLFKKYGNLEKVMRVLNKESGLKGIAGNSDMREVQKMANEGNERAQLALEKYIHEVRKVIGSYLLELKYKVDAIVFTGGIGENDKEIVRKIVNNLEEVGVILDCNPENLTLPVSPVKVLQLSANEELAMAKATMNYEEK